MEFEGYDQRNNTFVKFVNSTYDENPLEDSRSFDSFKVIDEEDENILVSEKKMHRKVFLNFYKATDFTRRKYLFWEKKYCGEKCTLLYWENTYCREFIIELYNWKKILKLEK